MTKVTLLDRSGVSDAAFGLSVPQRFTRLRQAIDHVKVWRGGARGKFYESIQQDGLVLAASMDGAEIQIGLVAKKGNFALLLSRWHDFTSFPLHFRSGRPVPVPSSPHLDATEFLDSRERGRCVCTTESILAPFVGDYRTFLTGPGTLVLEEFFKRCA
jgi:hypothetical protein